MNKTNDNPNSELRGNFTRRGFIHAAIAGAIISPMVKLAPFSRKTENRRLLRPPFARVREDEFLKLCTRCGLCTRACKTNTLQAAFNQAGWEGLMTPVLCPEIAGCDPECNACGQVCPTGAIARFGARQKITKKLGTAKLELDRCIGWTENMECNECVKICPTQAIKIIRRNGVAKPAVIQSAECNGCGLCEKRCNEILANASACVVTNAGRGLPTDVTAIMKNMAQKKKNGKQFLPEAKEGIGHFL